MPRPKRSKVAPSASAPPGNKATKPVESKAQSTKSPFDDLYDLSETEAQTSRNLQPFKDGNGKRKATQRNNGAIGVVMSTTDSTKKRKASDDFDHCNKQTRASPTGGSDVSLSSPEVEMGRRAIGVNTPGLDGSRLAIGNFRRRARQASILDHKATRDRSSSVETNLACGNGLTSVNRKNALRFGGLGGELTKPAFPNQSTSILGLEHTLQVVDRGTPAVGTALKIGNFKRRAREPSILGTAQKNRQPRPPYNDDDDDDFNPEDESTPLKLTKSRIATISTAASSSNSKTGKLSPDQLPFSSSSSPSREEHKGHDKTLRTHPLENQLEDGDISTSSEDIPLPSREARHITPDAMSETMAPPRSTSSSSTLSTIEGGSPSIPAPSRGRRVLRTATPISKGSASPISSPPSLTHSPNYRMAMALKPKQDRCPPVKSSRISTAQLQSLLPRRRRRVHDDPFNIQSSEDEVDTSGLASDDDELSHLNVRAPQRQQHSILSRTPAILKKTIMKPKTATKPKQSKAKVVYGSRARVTTSDKENEEVDLDDSLAPLPDEQRSEDSQELEKRVGAELKKAARKFAEVDKWEMEFEDVTSSSSSPLDAR